MSVCVSLSAQNRVVGGCEVYAYAHGRPAPLALPSLGPLGQAPAVSFDKQAFVLPDVEDPFPHATFGVLNGLGAFMCQPGAKDLDFRFANDEDMQAVLADDGARILKHAFLLESLSQLRYGGTIDNYHMDVRGGGGPARAAMEPPAPRAPRVPQPPVSPLADGRGTVVDVSQTPSMLPAPVAPVPTPPRATQPAATPSAPPSGPVQDFPGRPDPHSDGHSPLPMRETSGNPHR